MEDQQSASGDLTQEAAAAETGPDSAPEPQAAAAVEADSAPDELASESAADDAGENAAESAAEESAAAASDGQPEEGTAAPATKKDGKTRRKRLAGKRMTSAVGMAATLFVGSAAFAGAMVQPYLVDRTVVATKLTVARTAADAITTLWTYTPDNMDTLADRAANYLSGDFAAQYRRFVDQIAAPNKQAKITNNTEVTGAAVESLSGQDAIAIVYTNTTTTSPVTKNIPALKYLSYRLFMRRHDGRWLVNRMTTITSLDLTPHV